jgi:hypothetical protein
LLRQRKDTRPECQQHCWHSCHRFHRQSAAYLMQLKMVNLRGQQQHW